MLTTVVVVELVVLELVVDDEEVDVVDGGSVVEVDVVVVVPVTGRRGRFSQARPSLSLPSRPSGSVGSALRNS